MDKSVRDELRAAVIAAREALEHDFREQLEGVYGIYANGTIKPLEGLTHLGAQGRAYRNAIVSALAHYQAEPAQAAARFGRE